jgi:nitric oxide reductase NorD protein
VAENEHQSAERQSFLELTRSITSLPLDQTAAVLETSAAIAGISLRTGIEFLRAAPAAAQVLQPAELRAWGEIGRRLAMADYETAISFFVEGVEPLRNISPEIRPAVFALCTRQIVLSTAIGRDTLRALPQISAEIADDHLLGSILEIATEIARRSAKHSAEFLNASSTVSREIKNFNDANVTAAAVTLAGTFAARAGGIAADAWAVIPEALAELSAADAIRLLNNSNAFLERGGGAALHILIAGGEILRRAPEIFDEWIALLWVVAAHGNASLVAFVRSSPGFIRVLNADANRAAALELSRRVLALTKEIATVDGEAALACFRSSARALRSVSIEQFETWARRGLMSGRTDARARRSYFSLETRGSYEALHSGSAGLALDSVQPLLRLYVEALTGREVEIAPLAAVPDEARIDDGRTIHLPSLVNEFGDEDLDFRLYKVLAAHAAGQIEFGTYARGGMLPMARSAIAARYSEENVDALDAFSLADEIVQLREDQTGNAEAPPITPADDLGYRDVLKVFPMPQLARRVFGTLENGRIDRRLRRTYRGLNRDLDLIRQHLSRSRPQITELPISLVPFELLFQVTMLGGAREDARNYYGQIVSELETIVSDYLLREQTTVADTLMATSRVYDLFQTVTPADDSVQQVDAPEDQTESDDDSAERMKQREGERTPERRDARELFNAWNDPSPESDPD